MVCLGLEPRAARWKVQTNPLSYGDTPTFMTSTPAVSFGEKRFIILVPGSSPHSSSTSVCTSLRSSGFISFCCTSTTRTTRSTLACWPPSCSTRWRSRVFWNCYRTCWRSRHFGPVFWPRSPCAMWSSRTCFTWQFFEANDPLRSNTFFDGKNIKTNCRNTSSNIIN